MLRWFERFAAVLVLVLTIGVLLACWMPAYVGASDGEVGRAKRLQQDKPPRSAR